MKRQRKLTYSEERKNLLKRCTSTYKKDFLSLYQSNNLRNLFSTSPNESEIIQVFNTDTIYKKQESFNNRSLSHKAQAENTLSSIKIPSEAQIKKLCDSVSISDSDDKEDYKTPENLDIINNLRKGNKEKDNKQNIEIVKINQIRESPSNVVVNIDLYDLEKDEKKNKKNTNCDNNQNKNRNNNNAIHFLNIQNDPNKSEEKQNIFNNLHKSISKTSKKEEKSKKIKSSLNNKANGVWENLINKQNFSPQIVRTNIDFNLKSPSSSNSLRKKNSSLKHSIMNSNNNNTNNFNNFADYIKNNPLKNLDATKNFLCISSKNSNNSNNAEEKQISNLKKMKSHSPETKISDLELNMSFNRKQSNISGVNQSLNFNNLKDYRKPTFNRYKSNSPYKSNDYLKSHQKVGPLVNLQSDLDNTIKDIQSSTPMSPQISLNKGINLLLVQNLSTKNLLNSHSKNVFANKNRVEHSKNSTKNLINISNNYNMLLQSDKHKYLMSPKSNYSKQISMSSTTAPSNNNKNQHRKNYISDLSLNLHYQQQKQNKNLNTNPNKSSNMNLSEKNANNRQNDKIKNQNKYKINYAMKTKSYAEIKSNEINSNNDNNREKDKDKENHNHASDKIFEGKNFHSKTKMNMDIKISKSKLSWINSNTPNYSSKDDKQMRYVLESQKNFVNRKNNDIAYSQPNDISNNNTNNNDLILNSRNLQIQIQENNQKLLISTKYKSFDNLENIQSDNEMNDKSKAILCEISNFNSNCSGNNNLNNNNLNINNFQHDKKNNSNTNLNNPRNKSNNINFKNNMNNKSQHYSPIKFHKNCHLFSPVCNLNKNNNGMSQDLIALTNILGSTNNNLVSSNFYSNKPSNINIQIKNSNGSINNPNIRDLLEKSILNKNNNEKKKEDFPKETENDDVKNINNMNPVDTSTVKEVIQIKNVSSCKDKSVLNRNKLLISPNFSECNRNLINNSTTKNLNLNANIKDENIIKSNNTNGNSNVVISQSNSVVGAATKYLNTYNSNVANLGYAKNRHNNLKSPEQTNVNKFSLNHKKELDFNSKTFDTEKIFYLKKSTKNLSKINNNNKIQKPGKAHQPLNFETDSKEKFVEINYLKSNIFKKKKNLSNIYPQKLQTDTDLIDLGMLKKEFEKENSKASEHLISRRKNKNNINININYSQEHKNANENSSSSTDSSNLILNLYHENNISGIIDFESKLCSNVSNINNVNQILTKTTKDDSMSHTIKNYGSDNSLKVLNSIEGPEDLHYFYVHVFQKKKEFTPKFDI